MSFNSFINQTTNVAQNKQATYSDSGTRVSNHSVYKPNAYYNKQVEQIEPLDRRHLQRNKQITTFTIYSNNYVYFFNSSNYNLYTNANE